MPSIKIVGDENIIKESMDNALNANTSIGLNASKAIIVELLQNGVVTFDLTHTINIIGLLRGLNAANANVEFIEE